MTPSRGVVAGQVKVLNKVVNQMIDEARNKINATDFDTLPETERAVAYAEVETLVKQIEGISSEATKLAAGL